MATKYTVTISLPALLPASVASLCAHTVRELPSFTLTPPFTVSVAPSQRIRCTSPLTVMRAPMVTVPGAATYQPDVSTVWSVSWV